MRLVFELVAALQYAGPCKPCRHQALFVAKAHMSTFWPVCACPRGWCLAVCITGMLLLLLLLCPDLFNWATGREGDDRISREQAMSCARRPQGRSWEVVFDKLMELGESASPCSAHARTLPAACAAVSRHSSRHPGCFVPLSAYAESLACVSCRPPCRSVQLELGAAPGAPAGPQLPQDAPARAHTPAGGTGCGNSGCCCSGSSDSWCYA